MRLVMMGTGTFAEPTFEAILNSDHQVVGLVTQPDRAVGQERGSTRQTGKGMKAIALERTIPSYQPESINTPAGIEQLRSWQPDLLVVAAYGQILSNDVLSVPKQGGINVHASLLPKYRGAAPVSWAIWQGETQTGVTIIQMTTRLDAGGMILQETVDIDPAETAGELEARLAPLGAKLALQAIEQVAAGTARPIVQNQTQVTKAPKLKKEHGLIDWGQPATRVACQVRALQPWPTAYTYLHRPGKEPLRIIIGKVTAAETPDIVGWEAPVGSVFAPALTERKLIVWAGEASRVEVQELQPAGKKRMAAAEFLRGHPLRPGDRFGPEVLS